MELSKEFWEIKKCNETAKLIWEIIEVCRSDNSNRKRYRLCLNEKYQIATYKEDNLFNKRTEIMKPYSDVNPCNKILLQCLVLNCCIILCKVIQLTID